MAVDSTQQIFAAFAHNSVNVNSKLSEIISYIWEAIKFSERQTVKIIVLVFRDRYYIIFPFMAMRI